MPQLFQVVRCFDCETFQTKHVAKAKRWDCKVCGVKQTLKKVFIESTAADCRRATQHLNIERAKLADRKAQKDISLAESFSVPHVTASTHGSSIAEMDTGVTRESLSKWSHTFNSIANNNSSGNVQLSREKTTPRCVQPSGSGSAAEVDQQYFTGMSSKWNSFL